MNGQTGRKKPGAEPGAIGSYVDAACGKCKSITSHIVLAKVGSNPTRVECRTCHAMHAYRLPGTKKAAAKSQAGRTTAAKAAKQTPEETWATHMRQAKGVAVPYSPSGQFALGSRVKHPSFGEGVVARQSSPTVCEVVFAERTVKLLMQLLNDAPGR
jgi:hypothetical protein